ncbi:MAG: metallopeptidase TldD-related protein, partial [Actinomycetota bacterium]|nr:metallopeptidase TldD-related protein [Actinomycetota bacterium]
MIGADELTEAALAASKADGCVVLLTDTSEATLRWANNTMTTNGHSTTRSFAVISIIGDSAGTVSGNGVDLDEVHAVVAASEQTARQSGPARDAAPLVEGAADDDFDAPAAATEIGVFARLADELAVAFGEAPSGRELLYGFAEHRLETTWLASSTGLRRRWVQPTGTVEVNGKIADDLARSAWAGAYTADFIDVDLTAIIAEVRRRLGWSQRQLELPAGRYETILPPSAVADLMIDLAWSMEGRPAHEGRSPWSAPAGSSSPTRLGEQLTDLPLTLSSDPFVPGLSTPPVLATTASSDSMSVFDNGEPARQVDWLRNGTVNALAYPRAAAGELGGVFTPPPENLVLTGGSSASTDDLVARTERGLLLTCLWYIREVDPTSLLLTGLTRDGVYLVEGGEVVGQVNNFRFNESPIDLLDRFVAASETVPSFSREWGDYFARTATPALRVP